MVLASGGQDGAICLWDVLTGSRVSHICAHRGDVTSLTCTTSCVISSGLDDVISIWDRTSGIKHYSIQQVGSCPIFSCWVSAGQVLEISQNPSETDSPPTL